MLLFSRWSFRYFDVEEQIKVKPEHVIALSLAFAAVVVLMKFLA